MLRVYTDNNINKSFSFWEKVSEGRMREVKVQILQNVLIALTRLLSQATSPNGRGDSLRSYTEKTKQKQQ